MFVTVSVSILSFLWTNEKIPLVVPVKKKIKKKKKDNRERVLDCCDDKFVFDLYKT